MSRMQNREAEVAAQRGGALCHAGRPVTLPVQTYLRRAIAPPSRWRSGWRHLLLVGLPGDKR